MLVVPLLAADRIVGALVVRRKQPGEFPKGTVDLLQTFAAQSVLAIQNARLFSEIEDKSRQLADASKHKSQFLANMSHELRTPLNAVLGYTELILDDVYGETPAKMREVLDRIQRNGSHLLGLINDVLDLSKIEAGQLTLALADYSMREVVSTVCTAVESLAKEKHIALKVEVPPDLPGAQGDERKLTQVLLNLVGNAIKFTDEGEIAIKASAANGSITVSVRDSAPASPKPIKPRFSRNSSRPIRRSLAKRRHRTWTDDLQAHRRAARRAHLGRVEPGPGIEVFLHASCSGRAAKGRSVIRCTTLR